MTVVKLSAKLPDDNDLNGLEHWARTLRKDPMQQYVAIVYLDVAKMVTDYEKAIVSPVTQVVAVEVLGTAADCPASVQKAFLDAHRRRTSKEPLPFEDPEPEQPERLQLTDGVDVDASLTEAEHIIIEAEIVDDDDGEVGPVCRWCMHSEGDHDLDDPRPCRVTAPFTCQCLGYEARP